MRNGLTDAEHTLLEKFGFRIEGDRAVHRKLEVDKPLVEFQGFASLEELETFVKDLLRNQCRLR